MSSWPNQLGDLPQLSNMTAVAAFTKGLMAALLILFCSLFIAENQDLPPTPKEFFNDYAGVTSPAKQQELNGRLASFCKDSSNQVVVAIFPRMDSALSLDEYTLKVAKYWGVGERGKNNGVVLFVFVNDHKMRIQVGLGLTNVLTDEFCRKILDQDLKPRFRNSDFNGGLSAAVNSIISTLNKRPAKESEPTK